MQAGLFLFLALIFLVALTYSSVGHGGASGYLALLSLYSFPPETMSASALVLNLLVAGTAFWAFWKCHHFSWSLTWPFIVTSVPAAFLGSLARIPASLYSVLLAGVLFFAGVRLMGQGSPQETKVLGRPTVRMALASGAGIGLVSGMVGIGGGIFLSPLLLLLHWAGVKQAAATSAFFILVNSAAGLLGRWLGAGLEANFSPFIGVMILAAFLGGIVGSRLGAAWLSVRVLRRILGLVLFAATFKLLYFL